MLLSWPKRGVKMDNHEIMIVLGNRREVGSCNLCLDKETDHVWVISFLNPDRNGMEFRLCYQCMDNFLALANKVVGQWEFRDVP